MYEQFLANNNKQQEQQLAHNISDIHNEEEGEDI